MNLKESIDIKIIYWDDEPTEYLDDVTHNDIVDIQNDPNVYKIVDVTNGKKKTIYLAESKKSVRKSLNEKVDSKFKYTFNHSKDGYEIMQFDDYNFAILAVPNGKSLFSDNLPKFKIEKTYIYDTCVNNRDITLFVGIVEELGWCFIAFDKLANNNNIFAYFISGKTKEGAYHAFHEYKQEFDLRIEEKKSIKESKVDFQSVIDKVIPKEYAHNKNAYKYALHCVESLYNEDEYDSDNAKVYFLNCYISDLFPSWVDDLGEEEMDALANSLYDGLFKWSDIDSSWLK